MKKQLLLSSYFRASAVGLATAVLFGCGGGSDSGSASTQPSVQVLESAGIMSVTTELPSSSGKAAFEAQTLSFTFDGNITSGPSAGLAMNGRLDLMGESDDGTATEIEGRFFPDATPIVPSRDDLKVQFEASRKALKVALRTDINALSDQLKAALASGAVAGSDGPSAAQKAALATFKTQFVRRMDVFRVAMSALIGDFRVARRNGSPSRDDDDNAARGFEVRGTIAANGAMNLTITLADKSKVAVSGTLAADGNASGTLTGPASGDTGAWTATPTDGTGVPAPTPAPAPAPAPSTSTSTGTSTSASTGTSTGTSTSTGTGTSTGTSASTGTGTGTSTSTGTGTSTSTSCLGSCHLLCKLRRLSRRRSGHQPAERQERQHRGRADSGVPGRFSDEQVPDFAFCHRRDKPGGVHRQSLIAKRRSSR